MDICYLVRPDSLYCPTAIWILFLQNTGMHHITTFRSTTDHIYDGGPIRLYCYNTYHCVIIAYSIQYSNMLYRFVA
jgi:hypothetical protein